MKVIYIFIILSIILLCLLIIFLVRPREGLYIYPSGGLANRLRVLMAYIQIAKNENKPLKVYWPNNNTCNGLYRDIFQPLDGVTFVSLLESIPRHYSGYETYDTIMNRYGLKFDEKEAYSDLKLLPRLQEKVNSFVAKNNLSSGVSVHVRRTDHTNMAKNAESHTTSNDFFEYIDSLPSGIPIFLATDNNETQKEFKNRYPGRVIVYKEIIPSSSVRQTSLEDAILDIFIAVQTLYFKGSGYSSYSGAIEVLRT